MFVCVLCDNPTVANFHEMVLEKDVNSLVLFFTCSTCNIHTKPLQGILIEPQCLKFRELSHMETLGGSFEMLIERLT
jgi:hypothetical protein